jgi:hypothetical protein
MKKLIAILSFLLLFGCAPQYEVVQQLRVNMYHLYNTRTNEVQIILTSDTLKEGSMVKLKNIKVIAEVEEKQ